MKKKLFSVVLAVSMLLSAAHTSFVTTVSAGSIAGSVTVPSPQYGTPTVTPPSGVHPRVMLRSADLTVIRDNLENEQNAEAVAAFNTLKNASINTSQSIGNASNNSYYRDYLNTIQAKAFDYVLNGNTSNGNTAIAAMTNFLNKVSYGSETDVCREVGWAVFVASEVYDWCYPLMNDSQRSTFISKCETLFKNKLETGYPPSELSHITGHAGEFQLFRDVLAFGIAVYDEKPAVYNYVMSRIEYKMAPARKWFYESGAPYQGDMYGFYRYLGELYAEALVSRMTGGTASVFTDSSHQGFKTLPYHWQYMHRPDGRMFTRGDDNSMAWSITGYNTYHFVANFFAGNMFGNSVFKGEAFRRARDFSNEKYNNVQGLNAVTWLIMNDTGVNAKTNPKVETLSKYFGSPSGEIVARTSNVYGTRSGDAFLSNDAAAAYMRIGEYYGGNHDDLDSGSFQLYYKGILASASGFYDDYSSDHTRSYRKRTISHNALTISGNDDASTEEEKAFYGTHTTSNGLWDTGVAVNDHSNDGGQKVANPEISDLDVWQNTNGRYKRGTVIDHYTSDGYSYIKGDITPAYASGKLHSGTPVIRNMAFINTGDADVPAFMLIYDKIRGASNSNVPQFNLHTQTEPTISGSKTTVVTDGGKLTVKTLLPSSPSITKLGGSGNQFKVGGTNYAPSYYSSADESGWGRIEIKPSTVSGETEFLNVLAVSDSGYSTDIPATKIEGTNVKGARVLDDVVLFSSSSGRVSSSASFTVSGSDTDLDIKVLGVKPGFWQVTRNGSYVAMPQATVDEDGNGAVLSFRGDAGSYTLSYLSSEIHWLNVFTEDFEGDWEAQVTDEGGSGTKTPNSSGDCNKSDGTKASLSTYTNTGAYLGGWFKRIAQGSTVGPRWIQTKPSLAGEYDTSVVRFSFDIAKSTNGYSTCTVIAVQGDKNSGTTNSEAAIGVIDNEQWLFSLEDGIYYGYNGSTWIDGAETNGKRWHHYDFIIDCRSDKFDVYHDGEQIISGYNIGVDFDSIDSLKIATKKTGSKTVVYATYVDNIAMDVLKIGEITTSSVTLNTNGGTINSGNVTEYNEGEYVMLPTDITKSGYAFGGWYENSSFTGSAVTAIPVTATGNKTYYARWLNTYSVTLNTNGGTITDGNITEYIETRGAELPTSITKDGSVFGGWYENSSFTGSAVTAIPANATGAKTYYAKWEAVRYPLTFETNGGTINGVVPESYASGEAAALPQDVTRSGFTFAGWYFDKSFTEGPVAAIPASAEGGRTLYARYTQNGRTEAEITDNYIIAAAEGFDAYEANEENCYTGTFAEGFANLTGYADYTSYICSDPYNSYRGNVLGLRHPASATSLYWGMNSRPNIPAGARGDLKKIKFSFDTARDFGSQSQYQLDLIVDGENSANEVLPGQKILRISKGRSIHYFADGSTTTLTDVKMPRNDWTHIDLYIDTENHLFSVYQDSLPLAENIEMTGELADFDEITGLRFKSVTESGAPETHAEYLDNVSFAVLADKAKPRPVYSEAFSLGFDQSALEYYSTPDPGMVENGGAYITDDPAGIHGQVMRLRHTKSTVSAQMAASGEGSALGNSSKDEFRRVRFGFSHYVQPEGEDSTSSTNSYYKTDIVVYGDTTEETYTGIGMFAENAVLRLYDGAELKAVATYARDKWQRIEFYADCIAGTYDAYLDGHIIAEDFALPMAFTSIYAMRISAHKLDEATDSYTYVDDLSFKKSEAVHDYVTISGDFDLNGEQFEYNVTANGIASADNAYLIVAIYNPNDKLMYAEKQEYTGISGVMSDEGVIAGLSEGAYLKAFIWDMDSITPLGDYTRIDVN